MALKINDVFRFKPFKPIKLKTVSINNDRVFQYAVNKAHICSKRNSVPRISTKSGAQKLSQVTPIKGRNWLAAIPVFNMQQLFPADKATTFARVMTKYLYQSHSTAPKKLSTETKQHSMPLLPPKQTSEPKLSLVCVVLAYRLTLWVSVQLINCAVPLAKQKKGLPIVSSSSKQVPTKSCVYHSGD